MAVMVTGESDGSRSSN